MAFYKLRQRLSIPAYRDHTAKYLADHTERGGDDECWNWTAGLNSHGYGSIKIPAADATGAHRVAYFFAYGDPGSLHVLHRCDNRRCVNPAHLFLGTNAENIADKVAKGRAKGRPQAGVLNAAAKLSHDDVVRIKSLLPQLSNRAIAKRFSVGEAMISRIRTGKAWKMVDAVGIEPTTPPV